MKPWIAVLAAGVGSYLFRVSMLVLTARAGGVPVVLERAARFAVPTAFAALAATSLAPSLTLHASSVPPLAAVAAAALAVRRTGSPPTALLVGLPTLWLLSAVVGT